MRSASDPRTARVVRVLPDEPAIDKTFDYLVPESLGDQVRVGTRVRIALSGRRVGGWVVAVDVVPPPGVEPRPLAKVSGHGPGIDLIDLAHWAAWRWAGRPASFLRTANPERVITALPTPARPAGPAPGPTPLDPLIVEALTPPPVDPRPAAAAGPAAGAGDPVPPGGAVPGDPWASFSGPSGAPPTAAVSTAGGPRSPTAGGHVADPAVGAPDPGPPADAAPGAARAARSGPLAAPAAAAVSVGGRAADPAFGGVGSVPPGGAVASCPGSGPASHGDGTSGDRMAPDRSGSAAPAVGTEAERVHVSWGSFPERTPGAASPSAAGRAAGVQRGPTAGDEAGSAGGAPAAGGHAGEAASAGEREGAAGAHRASVAGGDEAAVGGGGRAVVRLAPAVDPFPLVRAAAGLGNALVICPTVAMARSIGMRLRRDGVGVAFHPRDWAAGAAGATVVGTRAAAWAPVAGLAAVVVLDEHDEGHAQEQAPTWHARDVVAERARRAGVPCVLVSPCPSLEALAWGRLLAPARNVERAGWPIVDVVDRRDDDPRTGLFSPRLVDLLRSERRVVCVLNRTGRAKLLACAACGELARCEACDAALSQTSDEPTLACPRCGTTRPVVCGSCGGTRLKLLRQGVSRVREELEALVGEPVDEVSSLKDDERRPSTRVVVGTEAVLHQVDRADVVAFLDLDQELLAARYRAVEQALGLVARAARLVGGKDGGGRLVLQTRVPRHEVVQAALHGDPARVAEVEADRRELLRFPPAAAMAEVSGPAAEAYIAALRKPSASAPAAPPDAPLDLWSTTPEPSAAPAPALAPDIEILGPADGRWLVRAPDHTRLCDTLATVPRPPGRLRLAVDPLRV